MKGIGKGARYPADLSCAHRAWPQDRPGTYYAAKTRPPSARSGSDEQHKVEIVRVFEADYDRHNTPTLESVTQ